LVKLAHFTFTRKKFLLIIICLLTTLIIDTSLLKVYDLTYKGFVGQQIKVVLFSVNSSLCLILGFIIIRYVQVLFRERESAVPLRNRVFNMISIASYVALSGLFIILVLQLVNQHSYSTNISMGIIAISYGVPAVFVGKLSALFLSWYKSNHNLIVFLYFISMSLIAFNLTMTAVISDLKLADRPDYILQYVGGSTDISVGRHKIAEDIYQFSAIASFFSLWTTTAVLMKTYREKLFSAVVYWVLLCLPLAYFVLNTLFISVFQYFFSPFLSADPVLASIILTLILSLSRPIGGLTFGAAFWNISRLVSYEKHIRVYMIFSGWGILLLFSANQAVVQTLTPYPPFGLATLTILVPAAYLILIGIYNSAVYVSISGSLRKSIYNLALESKLLGLIGQAEMEKSIQKTVDRLSKERKDIPQESSASLELDSEELKKYLDFVIKEIKEKGST
jgi:hypothetical protein